MIRAKHGQSIKGKVTPEYRAWQNMKNRCKNPNRRDYKDYGDRGIKVCKRWQNFLIFYKDMGPRPGPKYSIDRIDNDGNYEPNNCRWATPREQANNRRPRSCGPSKQRFFYTTNKKSEYFKSNSQRKIAEMFNLNHAAISKCLRGFQKAHKGWFFQWI